MPEVLISGHHENIKKYRNIKSLSNTYKKRPELLKTINLSDKEKEIIDEIKSREEE